MGIKLSATRISAFLQCKKRYWLSYVKKADKMVNSSFLLGRAVHETLEYAGHVWVDNDLTEFTAEQKKDILLRYNEESVKQGIFDSVAHLEGLDIIKMKLKSFEIEGKIVGLETKFGFADSLTITTKRGTELIGAIDKVVELNPETIAIMDYKTSKSIPDKGKLKSDVQLSMYNLVARQLFPDHPRVVMGLDMLRKNEQVYTYRTPEELDAFEHYLDTVYDTMLAYEKKNKRKKKVDGRLNILCSWCDYRNICEEFQEAATGNLVAGGAFDSLNSEELHTEWERVGATLKLLEMRKSDLSVHITNKMEKEEGEVSDGEKMFTLRQNKRQVYDPEALGSIIPQKDFAKLVSIKNKKVADYASSNPALRSKIEEAKGTAFTAPFISTRKIPKTKTKK